MVFAQIPTGDVINQLAGKDIAVILAIAFVFLAIYLVLTALNGWRQTNAIDRLTQANVIQTDVLKDLITTNHARTEVADRAYQEIFRVGEKISQLSESATSVTNVAEELRKIATEMLSVARSLERSAQKIESSPTLPVPPQE